MTPVRAFAAMPQHWADTQLPGSIRSLLRDRVTAGAAVLSLGLGIGANVAVFRALDSVFFRNPPHVHDARSIVTLTRELPTASMETRISPAFAYRHFERLRQAPGQFQGIAAYSGGPVLLESSGSSWSGEAAYVSGEYFSLLGTTPRLGRLLAPVDEHLNPPAAVLSYDFWARGFSRSPDVLGKLIRVNSHAIEIVGVSPPGFHGISKSTPDIFLISTLAPAIWMPQAFDDRYHAWFLAARVQRAEDRRSGLRVPGLRGNDGPAITIRAQPILPLGISDPRRGQLPTLLFAASFALLLIACTSTAALLTARGLRNMHQTAVRMALGATRTRLLVDAVTEAAVLIAAGAALAVFISARGVDILRPLGIAILPTSPSRMTGFLVLCSVVALIAVAPAPLAIILHPRVQTVLQRGSSAVASSGMMLRKLLLVAQISIAFTLLFCTALFVRSLVSLQSVDVGFDQDELIVLDPGRTDGSGELESIFSRLERLTAGLRLVPEVKDATIGSNAPVTSATMMVAEIAGVTAGPVPVQVIRAGARYFEVAGIRILRGSELSVGSRGFAVVDALFARKYLQEPVLGKCVRVGYDRECSTVIGVAEEFKSWLIDDRGVGTIYVPLRPDWPAETLSRNEVLIRTHSARPSTRDPLDLRLLQIARYAAPELNNVQIYHPAASFDRQLKPWRTSVALLAAAALIATICVALGLYGVVASVARYRRREFAVRAALGASASRLGALVGREALQVLGVGIALGLMGGLAAGGLLRHRLYLPSRVDFAGLIAVLVLLTVVTLLASIGPVRSAMGVSPAQYLRED